MFENYSNAEYHADKTHLSSSSLKLLLKSPEQFYIEHVLGQKENIQKNSFDEGSYVHTLILEPHKVGDYAIFEGLRKAGSAFEQFKSENIGKTVLSSAQALRCQILHDNYKKHELACELVSGGFAEHSLTATLHDVAVKMRADYINVDKGYILDVKTTSMPTGADIFKETVIQYSYELSAALYCAIASLVYKKEFQFYWLVGSKSDNLWELYKCSDSTMATGKALVTKALHLYKKCQQTQLWTKEHSTSFNPDIVEV